MIAQSRSSWKIMQAAIYALMLRSFEEKFVMKSSKKRIFDLIKIFFEPSGHVILWSVLKTVQSPTAGNALSSPLFIILGAIPWIFVYRYTFVCSGCIIVNRPLLFFRQIKLIDPIIAVFLSEFGTLAFVFSVGLLLYSLFGVDWQLVDPLRWFLSLLCFSFFVLGLGILFSIGGFFFPSIIRTGRFFLRFLYLFSGIFFSLEMVPFEYQKYFTVNPLFQFIQISRESFSDSTTHYGDLYYLFQCGIVLLTISLGVYMLLRNKIMVEIMEH